MTPLDDLDAPTLESMRARLGCGAHSDPSTPGTRAACAGIAAFAAGDRPDAKRLYRKRLIGVGVAVDATGAVDPKLELLALDFQPEQNFHAAVELGDELGTIPVVAQSAEESRQIVQAATALIDAQMPSGNPAFEFARTMRQTTLSRVVSTTGSSAGITGNNRRLLRQGNGKLVILELPRANSHVVGKRFWVQVFDLQ